MNTSRSRRPWWIAAACSVAGMFAIVPAARAGDPPFFLTLEQTIKPELAPNQLGDMSLEDLMNVEVTSVSRHKQKASDAPAAVTVITHEDIAHSGLNSIPELLRLAPGMSVARFDANDWAISARGFNAKYANKLLVLIDGRTVYMPLTSGVTWDQQDYVLADLDRIEVIRGPGATMWGANAVNGVVSITTKDARDTQGLLSTGLMGNVDQIGSVRYGGKIDEDTYYRVFGMFRKTEDFVNAAGDDLFDGWQSSRGGFRIDRQNGSQDHLTLQGEAYQNLFAERATLPVFGPPYAQASEATLYAGGEHVLTRWTHSDSSESEYSLQAYYDRVYRKLAELGYEQHTWDLEFQHRFPLGEQQSLIWGAGARYLTHSAGNTSRLLSILIPGTITESARSFKTTSRSSRSDCISSPAQSLNTAATANSSINPVPEFCGLQVSTKVSGGRFPERFILQHPQTRMRLWSSARFPAPAGFRPACSRSPIKIRNRNKRLRTSLGIAFVRGRT